MSDEKNFLNGLIVKDRRENAPDFVVLNFSIKREEFNKTMDAIGGEWINGQVKRSRGGKLYAELDTWKPADKLADVARERPMAPAMDNFSDEVPF
jgi:hypothetical protein